MLRSLLRGMIMLDGPAELVLKIRCDGRYCSRCRFLRRRWNFYQRLARCVLFGRLKTEKWKGRSKPRAVRAEKCMVAGNLAWVLRMIESGKMKPVKAAALLRSGKVLAPYLPLQVSTVPEQKRRKRRA